MHLMNLVIFIKNSIATILQYNLIGFLGLFQSNTIHHHQLFLEHIHCYILIKRKCDVRKNIYIAVCVIHYGIIIGSIKIYIYIYFLLKDTITKCEM